MRIGLISDTHLPDAGVDPWHQVAEAFAAVDHILHGGDLYSLSVLDALGEIAPVSAVLGNGDDGSGGRPRLPDDPRLSETWVSEINGVRIGMIHRAPIPEFPPHFTLRRLLDRCFDGALDVLVYGDSHVEAIDVIDGVLCVNPGSPTLPRNQRRLGTIGFLDLADGTASATLWQLTTGGIEQLAAR